MLTRLQGWESRLADEIKASRTVGFTWHENDCCAFAARCVQAITGQDLFEIFRGSYVGDRSARRLLKQHCGVVGICDAFLGDRHPPLSARRGDLVLVSADPSSRQADAVAVCDGPVALAPGPDGLIGRPQGDWAACWRVG